MNRKARIKKSLINSLFRLRQSIGRIECKLEGECVSDADCFEVGSDVDYFYACRRCGRDVISGRTLEQWATESREDSEGCTQC